MSESTKKTVCVTDLGVLRRGAVGLSRRVRLIRVVVLRFGSDRRRWRGRDRAGRGGRGRLARMSLLRLGGIILLWQRSITTACLA